MQETVLTLLACGIAALAVTAVRWQGQFGTGTWWAAPVILAVVGLALRAWPHRVAQLAPAFPAGRLR